MTFASFELNVFAHIANALQTHLWASNWRVLQWCKSKYLCATL